MFSRRIISISRYTHFCNTLYTFLYNQYGVQCLPRAKSLSYRRKMINIPHGDLHIIPARVIRGQSNKQEAEAVAERSVKKVKRKS